MIALSVLELIEHLRQFFNSGGDFLYNIDHRSRTPVYEQIIESVKESVMRGVLSEGERLPSVRKLAKMMTLNPNTVQRAYSELEQQGVIIIWLILKGDA